MYIVMQIDMGNFLHYYLIFIVLSYLFDAMSIHKTRTRTIKTSLVYRKIYLNINRKFIN